MYNKIIWMLKRLFSLVLELIFGIFIKRDENFYLFGSKPNIGKDVFLNHSKYFFLYMQKFKDIKTVWLCDDEDMIQVFHENGFNNVYKRNSLKGLYSTLKAKYWFCDFSANQISKFNSSISTSIVINFFHGSGGIKKIGYDAVETRGNKSSVDNTGYVVKDSYQDKIYKMLKKRDDYYLVNCSYEAEIRKSGYGAKDKQNIITGSPRIDVLYKDIPYAEMFTEKDYESIKAFKNENKKILVYVPTYRETGKDISTWLKDKRLQEFLEQNNTILVCKLHPFDANSLKSNKFKNIYKMENTSDIYPILKYTDGMITDYSSIYFDYLHLNKPIIYHIPDIDEFTTQCRGFYRPYETITAGIYTKNDTELFNAMNDVINGIDKYKEQRKQLLDEIFVYQDGDNCKRVLEFIEGLKK